MFNTYPGKHAADSNVLDAYSRTASHGTSRLSINQILSQVDQLISTCLTISPNVLVSGSTMQGAATLLAALPVEGSHFMVYVLRTAVVQPSRIEVIDVQEWLSVIESRIAISSGSKQRRKRPALCLKPDTVRSCSDDVTLSDRSRFVGCTRGSPSVTTKTCSLLIVNSITPNASPRGTLGAVTRYGCRRYFHRYLTFEVMYLRYYST